MIRRTVMQTLQTIGRPVFATREIAALRSGSLSSTSQTLANLERQGIVRRVIRGIWCLPDHPRFSPYLAVPFLLPRHRAYVSFLSALHLHGIVGQIPQVIYVATTGRGRAVKTSLGTFSFHQLAGGFFHGFDWYGKHTDFLIASPEKALIDSLYLSGRKGKKFGFFPELSFGPRFSFREASHIADSIPDRKIRGYVLRRLAEISSLSAKR